MKLLLLSLAFALTAALVQDSVNYERVPNVPTHFHTAPSGTKALAGPFNGKRTDIALAYMKKQHPGTQWTVTSDYKTKHNGVEHVYLRQAINGITIVNAVANVNILKGMVLNAGHTVYDISRGTPEMPPAELPFGHLTPQKALFAVLDHVKRTDKASMETPETSLSYIILESGDLALTHKLVVDLYDDVYESYVDVKSGEIHGLYNWVASEAPTNAEYTVYQYPITDPGKGNGERANMMNPWEAYGAPTSPEGYHDQGSGEIFHVTIGNNVYAQENHDGSSSWENNYRPDGGNPSQGLKFDFPINFGLEPREYEDAAITNLFYWNNLIHDLFYLGGFDEVSGNFQENNWGRGGLGNDAVQANAQDGAGFNNANFYTPPDGQRPRMRMYIWTSATPRLDGDLDSGIITHEYGHGISNRLTGGPSVVNCLRGGQAGGMGEGWSDWWAVMLETQASDTADQLFPMGAYATKNPKGIRYFPYTYDMTGNPQTFAYISQSGYSGVHAKGSVWCEILYNVYWEMRTANGYDPDWLYGKAGNNALWQNVIDGLKLQPCNPNFVQARDAILEADKINYGGSNVCTMWKGFARRGLGVNAVATSNPVREDFSVPSECQ